MMDPRYRIFIVGVLIFAAISAGCIDAGPSVSPGASSPAPAVAFTPAVPETTTPQPAPTTAITVKATPALVQVKVFGTYRWAEYRENNTVTMPPNPRYQWESVVKTERSAGSYQGIPAFRYTITSTGDYSECCTDNIVSHTKNGHIFVTEMYYGATSGTYLGGSMTETIKGEAKPAVDLPADNNTQHPEDSPSGWMGITPLGDMNITLTDQGAESVTVPAGTFTNARKYTGSFRDGTPITFWVTSGIPVPVQYQFPNKYLDGNDPFQSFELMEWG